MKFRLEIVSDSEKEIAATDGTTSWRQLSHASEGPRIMSDDDNRRFIEEWADFDSPFIGHQGNGHRVDGVGCRFHDAGRGCCTAGLSIGRPE